MLSYDYLFEDAAYSFGGFDILILKKDCMGRKQEIGTCSNFTYTRKPGGWYISAEAYVTSKGSEFDNVCSGNSIILVASNEYGVCVCMEIDNIKDVEVHSDISVDSTCVKEVLTAKSNHVKPWHLIKFSHNNLEYAKI